MSTPTAVIGDAADGLDTELLAVAAVGLGVGVTIMVLRKGWRLLSGFIR